MPADESLPNPIQMTPFARKCALVSSASWCDPLTGRCYVVFDTEDGSPTLAMSASVDTACEAGEAGEPGASDRPATWEPMHNSKGALAETLTVYAAAARRVFAETWSPAFCSVGLGLGYNEFMTCCEAATHGVPPDRVSIESFEKDPLLRAQFSCFLRDDTRLFPFFEHLYARILKLFVDRYGLATPDARRIDLDIVAAGHGAFNVLPSKVIEWRGEAGAYGQVLPDTLIVRSVAQHPDRSEEFLLVYKVNAFRACLIEKIDARHPRGANLVAREVSDKIVPGFPCSPVN